MQLFVTGMCASETLIGNAVVFPTHRLSDNLKRGQLQSCMHSLSSHALLALQHFLCLAYCGRFACSGRLTGFVMVEEKVAGEVSLHQSSPVHLEKGSTVICRW